MPTSHRSTAWYCGIALLVALTPGCALWHKLRPAPAPEPPTEIHSSAFVESTAFMPAETPAADAVLTPFGAEAAADEANIVPAYTGGLQQAPLTYKPGHSLRPNPFYTEKPLFSIDAHNAEQFKHVLSDGNKALLAKFPEYRIDVYPTHRTAVYPQAVLDNTVLNAQRCSIANGGLSIAGSDCRGGLPFPTPKSGYEAMWNHLLAWSGIAVSGRERDWLVDHVTRPVLLAASDTYIGSPWYDTAQTKQPAYRQLMKVVAAPARIAGGRWLTLDTSDPVKDAPLTWEYRAGERGVRAAADNTHDLAADAGGLRFYDEIGLFNGPLDAFEFKLLGKREMIIPYNTYKQVYHCKPEENDLLPNFINPDCMRWELHRVWAVEAILKHGHSHASTRRVFYWDEDSWNAGASDEYDTKGKLYRTGFVHFNVWYESQINSAHQYVIYDFKKNQYALYGESASEGGLQAVDPWPAKQLTPDMLAGTSVR
jgi:hypothetical protein